MNEIAAQLGEVGLPEPVADLAKRDWDAIIVDGGHNGLTAAAYLAKAGQSVLVLESKKAANMKSELDLFVVVANEPTSADVLRSCTELGFPA